MQSFESSSKIGGCKGSGGRFAVTPPNAEIFCSVYRAPRLIGLGEADRHNPDSYVGHWAKI
ncbi:hypothetical protein PROH_13575 [Prochlorothrix hollandica PCC 9006 = CALU 1027]|uniref:Uncharacterized protein n=1 Tax=Prochlorothrix hollandica PCC 9006 = CALU 1027 TaxID=317619 RepID=A0A0M2PRV4_PROHO|nr:hypothetical protein PROH_13575 [Prochlorothrix hollandica PCC 9006 = CALU 1027]